MDIWKQGVWEATPGDQSRTPEENKISRARLITVRMGMKQYSRDYARKWILETLAKQLSAKGQEPDKRKSEIGAEERNSREQ